MQYLSKLQNSLGVSYYIWQSHLQITVIPHFQIHSYPYPFFNPKKTKPSLLFLIGKLLAGVG